MESAIVKIMFYKLTEVQNEPNPRSVFLLFEMVVGNDLLLIKNVRISVCDFKPLK